MGNGGTGNNSDWIFTWYFMKHAMHCFWEERTVVEHACLEEAKTGNDLIWACILFRKRERVIDFP